MKKDSNKSSGIAEESVFKAEVRRDISTFRRLHGKERALFVYDYFRWKILAALTAIICIILAVSMLWQGQQPVRLRVCVVLNNENYCTEWFDSFYQQLVVDGNEAAMDVDEDQPFDYDNPYSSLHEIEVMTKISSGRMDAAVCGPDMLSYLLSLNVCACMDEVLDNEIFSELSARGMTVYETAGLKENPDGSIDESDAVTGCFAIDISETLFGVEYNQEPALASGEEPEPLYLVIIRDNPHLEDCVALAYAITR